MRLLERIAVTFAYYREWSKEQMATKYGAPNGDVGLIDQEGGEFLSLLEYYQAKAPKTILEIGTYKGGSLWYWVRYAARNALIISVDLNHEQCKLWDTFKQMRPDVRVVRITGYSQDPTVIELVYRLAKHLDFVFIDGNHFSPVVWRDWENYGKRATSCVFHDVATGNKGIQDVRVLWNEIIRQYPGRVLTLIKEEPRPVCYGIGIVEP
jgi:predicted O-methyltransferase YrrM